MNYILKTKLSVIFIIFLTYCNVSIAATQCNPTDLRLIGNLSYYWSNMVDVGGKLKLSCVRPYGVRVEQGRYDSSFEVTCESSGKFSGIRSCDLACDMTDVLKASNKYNLPETFNLTTNARISASKLVRAGDNIEIQCLPYYNIPELSSSGKNVASYKYKCGSSDPVYPCKSQDVVFERTPPKSNIQNDFKPSYNCNLNQLIISNAKITNVSESLNSTSGASTVKPNANVELTCNAGYTAHNGIAPDSLGPKLTQKFTVTCDPTGTGKFLNTKACVQKCSVTSLIKSSNGKESSAVLPSAFLYNQSNLTNALGLVSAKNFDASPQYMDIGQAVKIQCAPGYEIRKTSKDHYFSSCSSIGFSDVEVCETIIPPCQNSAVSIDGILQSNGFERNGVTAVGTQVKARCQGGDIYFLDPQSKGIPRCIYDERTKTSSWNTTSFNCYNGCIAYENSNEIKKPVGNHAILTKRIRKVYSSAKQTIYLEGGNSQQKPAIDGQLSWVAGFMKHGSKEIPTIAEDWVEKSLTFSPNVGGGGFNDSYSGATAHFGFLVEIKTIVYMCKARQTELKNIKLNYRLFRASIGVHDDNKKSYENYQGVRSPMTFQNWGSSADCLNHNYWNGHRGDACINQLKSTYGAGETNTTSEKQFVSYADSETLIQACNNVLNSENYGIPEPKNDNCRGWAEYWVGNCSNYSSEPVVIQEVKCTKNGTTTSNNSFDTTFKRSWEIPRVSF